MANQTTNNDNQPNQTISLLKEEDIRYWTNYWGITEEDLRNAVGIVGVMANKIETWLKNNGKIE